MKKIIGFLIGSLCVMNVALADENNAVGVNQIAAAGANQMALAMNDTPANQVVSPQPPTTNAQAPVQVATPATNPATPAVDPNETAIQLNKQMKIVTKTFSETYPDLKYSVKVKYPQILGKNLSASAIKFNTAINNVVKDQLKQFKVAAQLDQVNMKNVPEELRKDTFNMDYDIDIVKPKNSILVSVRLSIEAMQAGRAHPYHAKRVVNFDLTTGKEIALNDLFKPHSAYLKAIASYSTKALDQKLKQDDWMVANGTKPDPKNFKNWNLQEDSILITFDEYQVAPYSYGAQEVEIPYSALKKILSTKAPIADCAKDAKGCEVG